MIALKFLGHWIGDLHQPLHVSYADDKGGNHVTLKKSIGCSKKLHGWGQNFRPVHDDTHFRVFRSL